MNTCAACGRPATDTTRPSLAGPVHAGGCPTDVTDVHDALISWRQAPSRDRAAARTRLLAAADRCPDGVDPAVDAVRLWAHASTQVAQARADRPSIRRRGVTVHTVQVSNAARRRVEAHADRIDAERAARGGHHQEAAS